MWSVLRQNLIILIILASLLTIILGKLLSYTDSPNLFLYIYGAMVTTVILFVFTIVLVRYRDPYEKILASPELRKKVKRHRPLVSIVVSVYNEEIFISRCIESLLSQSYAPKEIFIVDDGSTDGTWSIMQKYKNKDEVTLVRMPRNVGKKRAITAAVAKARGELLAFTDSDSILERSAISKLVAVIQSDKNIGAVNGHVRALNATDNLITKAQDAWYEGQFSIRKAFESIYGAVTCVAGPIALFRKEAIWNYIPAWANDKFLRQEFKFSTDRSLTNFVLSAGGAGKKLKQKYTDSPFIREVNYPERDWLVVYTRSARALTVVPNTLKKLVRQQIRWKKSFIRSIFLTGRYYYKRPLPVAIVYYSHILFVFAGPFIAFRHLVYLPFLAGSTLSAILYLAGICYIGLMFGLAYRLTVPDDTSRWLYRPFMSLMSTFLFSWLIFYSAATIKNMSWHRG